MRIMSEDEMIDLPYDQILLLVDHHVTELRAYSLSSYGVWWALGSFQTTAEALAEMESIRQSYLHGCKTHKIGEISWVG